MYIITINEDFQSIGILIVILQNEKDKSKYNHKRI